MIIPAIQANPAKAIVGISGACVTNGWALTVAEFDIEMDCSEISAPVTSVLLLMLIRPFRSRNVPLAVALLLRLTELFLLSMLKMTWLAEIPCSLILVLFASETPPEMLKTKI